MKKSIFLFFAAILCAMSVSAATVTSDGTARLYFNIKAVSWWNAGTNGDGNFGYFFNNSTGKNAWSAHAVKYSGDTYYLVIPKGTWAGVVLTRNNTSTAPSWNNKWNQTGDIVLSSTSNYISKFSEGSASVTWGTAVKPASDASVSAAASTIFVGASTTLNPSLTSNADINDIKSTTYSISPNTGASVSGNTFTATAEGTYTITATVTYHPDGYSSLTSTATAKTTIVAEVPAEETHDVTVSYMYGSTKIQDPSTVNAVGVETESEVTAPAKIKGYTFVNWTIGSGVTNTTGNNNTNIINILTKSTGDYTLTANYEPETVYFVNTDEWENVGAYAWTKVGSTETKNAAWPGVALTATGEKIGGYDVYSYTLGDGFENVIFTNINGTSAKNQTPDLKWVAGKYYVYNGQGNTDADDWYAKEDVEEALPDWLATNVHLAGTMTDWDNNKIEFKKATKGATTASIILNLTAGDYKFKIVDNGSWLGNNATIDKTISGWTFASDKGDCPLKATIAGDYTFTWAISTKKLSVTYPTICAITATANDAAMGTIAGAGDYGKGSTATLTANPKDGYLFVNWTKGGEVVATTQEYSFKVTEAVALVANFEAAPEEVHNVTVSYVCGDNKIADDQTVAAVGETTAKTVEAPEIWGYTFSSWTLGAGVTSANELTSNTIDINIVAGGSDFTLTANYTEIPKVTVYFVNNKKWSKVNAYGWKDGEAQGTPAWPGQDITANKETEKVADFDVYSYSVVPGSYDNIIFNDGSGTQTETFKWADGKYYYMGAAANYEGGTAEEVATALGAIVSYDYYIYGNMNDWKEDANYGMTDENEDGIYEKTLTFKNNAEFKVKGTAWYGSESVEGTYKEVSDNGGNIKLSLGADTEVTVMFNSNTKKISFEGLTIDGDVVTYSYYIADDGSLSGNSNWSSKSIGLTDDNSDGIYEKTFTNQAIGTYLMKVTNGTWDDGYVWGFSDVEGAYKEVAAAASDNNIEIKLTAATTFTVKFNSSTKKISFEGLTPNIITYTVVGHKDILGEAWNTASTVNIMEKDGDNYILVKTGCKLDATDYEYKVVKNGQYGDGEYPTSGNNKLTIAESGIYTVTFTYKVGTSLTATTQKTGDYTPEKATYTIAGSPALCGSEWKADDAANDMTDNGDGTFMWTKSVELARNVEFKIVKNHSFDVASYPSDNKVIDIKDGENYKTGVYTIVITFTEATKEIQVIATRTGDLPKKTIVYTVTVPAGTKQCYIVGDMNSWTAPQAMSPAGANKFSISIDNVTVATEYKYSSKDGDDTWAYVEKKNGNGSVDNRTYNANDVVERWNRIDIADGENAAIIGSHKGKGVVEVQVNRQFEAGTLYTLSLPFTMSGKSNIENIFGNGTIVYEFSKLEKNDEDLLLFFNDAITTIEAGKPYLILPGQAVDGFRYENVDVDDTNKSVTNSVDGTTVTMESVLSVAANAMTNGKYWLASGNTLYRTNTSLLSLRAVFDIQSSKANVRARVAFNENVETGVEDIITTETPVKVIKNGQLIIIRDGVKYNIQGQKL